MAQKARRTAIDYRFFDDYVEYTIKDSRGDKASFNTRYDELPGAFDYRTLQLRRTRMLVPVLLVMLITILALFQDPAHSLATLAGCILLGGTSLGLSYWLQHSRHRVYTALPAKSGKILVMKDAHHDKIIAELAARRLKALRRLAVIDGLNTAQAELKKFTYLKDEGAISEEEFETYRLRLGLAPELTAKTPKPVGAPLTLTQKAFLYDSTFSFFDRHLGFTQDDGALNAFNIWYADLPHASEYRRFSKRESYGFLVFIAGMIIAVALLNIHAGDNYYIGNEGLIRLLKAAALYVPVLAIAVYMAQRHTRKEYTIVPVQKGALRILQDGKHDDILNEIQRRRLGALREYAVLNHYNSAQAELKKFAWLKEQGAISGEEFENFRRRIVDDFETAPPPAAKAKPPGETLH